MYGRLVWLNFRRGVGLALLPLLAVLSWYAGRERYEDGVTLWVYASAATGFAAVLVGPVAGGAAAWVAYQAKRRRITPLLATGPNVELRHHAAALAAILAWVVLAYLLNGAYQAAVAMSGATWGGPDPAPVALGLALVAASTVVGYAAGLCVPLAVTAPIVAVALFAWLFGLVAGFADSSSRYLSPFVFLSPEEPGVLVRYWPAIFGPVLGWLSGVAALAVAASLLRFGQRGAGFAALAAGLLLTTTSGGTLLAEPAYFNDIPRQRVAYQPLCHLGLVEVCVHPAYEAVLPETAEVADAVFGPVVGLAGIPTRIEQFAPSTEAETGAQGSRLPIYNATNGHAVLAQDYALAAVEGRGLSETYPGLSVAQSVVGRWLLRQAGFDAASADWVFMPRSGHDSIETYDALNDAIDAEVDRFAQLPAGERRAWFTANLAALRQGDLELPGLAEPVVEHDHGDHGHPPGDHQS